MFLKDYNNVKKVSSSGGTALFSTSDPIIIFLKSFLSFAIIKFISSHFHFSHSMSIYLFH